MGAAKAPKFVVARHGRELPSEASRGLASARPVPGDAWLRRCPRPLMSTGSSQRRKPPELRLSVPPEEFAPARRAHRRRHSRSGACPPAVWPGSYRRVQAPAASSDGAWAERRNEGVPLRPPAATREESIPMEVSSRESGDRWPCDDLFHVWHAPRLASARPRKG